LARGASGAGADKTCEKRFAVDEAQIRRAIERLERGRRSSWWRRKGSKRRGFWYVDAEGRRITDEAALERIKALVLPPGWIEVRVNPSAGGRLQAIGVDSCGRLQYRYHEAFANKRQRLKYSKLVRFGERLPLLRKRANKDLCRDELCRERVLAAMVRLVNDLYIRLGSEKSVKRYKTFGVTTLRNRHVRIESDGKLVFNYVGKHHIRKRQVKLDEELATLLQKLKSIGGSRLFNYVDDNGTPHPLRSTEVNRYIKETMGSEFSAKDFRTWHGTLLAAEELAALGPPESEAKAKKSLVAAVRKVAEQLGNTPAVCRDCYIHPSVLESYQKGVTLEAFRRKSKRIVHLREADFEPEEIALLELLRKSGN
jgi:Topoisomerase IB